MPQPYFVRDYSHLIGKLVAKRPLNEAMELAVGGGGYGVVGSAELTLVTETGFRTGHSIIDVGCGIGRLASAI